MRKAADELVFANLIGLLFLPLMANFAWLDGGILGLAMLMVYLIARRWGSLLPYLAQFGIRADDRAGMRTALLYFSNILGSAAGAILTGFILTDYLTLVQIAQALGNRGHGLRTDPDRHARCRALGTVKRAAVAVGVLAIAVIAIPSMSNRVLENLLFKGTPIMPSLMWWRIAAASSPSMPTAPCSATGCMTDVSTRDCRTIETESSGPMR